MVFGTLKYKRKHDLLEALVDINRHVINVVLHCMPLDGFGLSSHCFAVLFGYFVRKDFYAFVCFHVDEIIRLVAIVQIEFFVAVVGVKEQNLVFAVPEMSESIEERFLFVLSNKGIGKDYDE